MRSFPLAPALRDKVASIQVVESADVELTVLPSTSVVLGMQFRGRVRAEKGLLSTAGVTGLQQSARRYAYLGDTESMLVRFTAQGAACLGVPASELVGQNVALDDLLPAARVRELRERALEASSTQERVDVVQAFLLDLPFATDALLARGLELIEADAEDVPSVATLARQLGLSERQLERRFLSRLGLTPKRYVALRRFERAVALAPTTASLTEVAFNAGYYDQSHFIRDFRRYTGRAPGELLRPQ